VDGRAVSGEVQVTVVGGGGRGLQHHPERKKEGVWNETDGWK
jgi:hypothetical protein